jgi:pimeloyl-ACP methyl ester carboxylesterase
MKYQIRVEGDYEYVETGGEGKPLLLLHGLFGALSNFHEIIDYFSKTRNVVVPILPIYTMPLRKLSVRGLVDHVAKFVQHKGYESVHALGNSLGGHVALIFALTRPHLVSSIILTGSSGLFESTMGSSFPKRGDYEYVKKKTEAVFYRPEVASKELIDEVFDIVNDRNKAIRLVITAKSAVRQNLADNLHEINVPTLLVWGKQDDITPPFVAEKFDELIKDTRLYFVEECGHAPMMEHPEQFNKILEQFLEEVEKPRPETSQA